MEETILEASSLPSHWSAQQAKLYALIQALQLSKGKKTNIYTDSRYAFATLHVHRALYKERGLLTASGKDIKSKEEILALLVAAWEPERVAFIHCRGHQKEDTPWAWQNRLVDKTTKQAAEGLGVTSEASIKALILAELPELTLDSPKYTEAQNQLAKVERAIKTEKGWWELPSDKLLIPEELAPTLVSQTHQVTHLGHDKLEQLN